MAVAAHSRRSFLSAATAAALFSAGRSQARLLGAPETSRKAEAAVGDELAALAEWVTSAGGRLGASVIRLVDGRELARHNPGELYNPASNQKLLTAAAVLKTLGGDFRYRTGVYGHLSAGTCHNLVLRGHGDPSLETHDFERLTRVLRELGLQRLGGSLFVDQSHFDDSYVPPAFEQQPDEWAGFRAPVSAVALAQNTVTLNVLAKSAGEVASVWLEPPGAATIRGEVQTTARGQGQSIRFSLAERIGRHEAVVGGQLAEGLGRLRFVRRLGDPRRVPGNVLRALLAERGVTSQVPVELGGEGETRRLAYITSVPLRQLLHRVGKHSDNFYAEMLFKSLGREATGEAGASLAGVTQTLAWLRSVGAPTAGTKVVNGSGLFDANRVSPALLTHVLRAAAHDPSLAVDYLAQLAISGVDGTLRNRLRRFPYRVRAKTGTLNSVVALSGYVLNRDAQPALAFSLIVEGLPGRHAASRTRMDRLVERMVAAT